MLIAVGANAQVGFINDNSPFPAQFVVTAPASAAGTFDFGSQVDGQGEWGPRLSQDLSAEIVWAYDGTDSLLCAPADNSINDVTGKFALIRRGACGFSLKAYNAQVAGAVGAIICNHFADDTQDGESLVGMLGGDSIDAVVIPAIFISRNSCAAIAGALDNGETVQAAFDIVSMYDPIGAWAYATPVEQIIPMTGMEVNMINQDTLNAVDFTVTATITEPSGATQSLSTTLNIGPLGDSVVTFDAYTPPAEIGTYSIEYSNDQNDETIGTAFAITELSWGVDNYDVIGGVGSSDEDFSTDEELNLTFGALYQVGDAGGVAQAVSFGLENAADLYIDGDDDANRINISLFNADADGDNIIDLANGFDDLTDLVGFAEYIITGNEGSDEILDVLLDEPVDLAPNGAYYLVFNYDGLEAATGISPRFLSSARVDYPINLTTPLDTDQLYSGWATRTYVARLHLDGFITNTQEPEFATDVMSISPNPVSDMLQLSLEFGEANEQVTVGITDMQGRVVLIEEYGTLLNGNFNLDVSNLANGVYHIGVRSTSGWQIEKFVKVN